MKKAFEVVLNQGKKSLIIGICLGTWVLTGCKKDKNTPNPDDDGGTVTPPDTTMVYVKANDANIRYTGRIDFSDPLAPQFSFPGVSIKAKFSGTAVDVVMKDYGIGGATTTNYFNIVIDGNVHKVLKVNSTDTLYCVARGLASGEHTIEVFKRTEATVGKSSFKGFRVLNNTALLDPGTSPGRKVEFIGDSFTCGYGNEKSYSTGTNSGFHSEFENNYSAWGAIVCRDLSAQYHCTAYSGRGMYRNNTGTTTGTVPTFYDRIHPDIASPTWTASNYVPDLVVIHLGTNDLAPEAWTPTPSMLDSANFVNAYIGLVNTVRTNYANAYIICVVPNSITDYYPVGLKHLTRMKNYTQAVVTHFNNASDNKVKYFLLTPQTAPYGEDWHPSNPTHLSMANQIKPFIQSTMGW